MSLALGEVAPAHKALILATSAASVVAALFALTPLGGESFHAFLLLPPAGLAAATVAALLARLPAQLFARAVQWSNLGLGVVLTLLGSHRERRGGVLLATACGFALLAMGRRGLVEAERRADRVPAAFRSSLLLLMVLALADAQSFALFGFARLDDRGGAGLGLLAAALALAAGFVLLLRLSLVGLVVDVATCVVVLVGAIAFHDEKLSPVAGTLAAVHVAAALPTIVALLRGGEGPRLGPRARAAGVVVTVSGLMATAVVAWALRV